MFRPTRRQTLAGAAATALLSSKRLPTIDELNAVAPDTPVFILHLYDRALLNAAALPVVAIPRTH